MYNHELKSWDKHVWREAVKVKIYRVVIPSFLAWPEANVTLSVCFDYSSADSYITNYPNMWLRSFMTIVSEDREFQDPTD